MWGIERTKLAEAGDLMATGLLTTESGMGGGLPCARLPGRDAIGADAAFVFD